MAQLTAVYGVQVADAKGSLQIEQAEWLPYTGYLTRYQFALLLRKLLYGTDDELTVSCGFDGDHYAAQISVYPTPFDMSFNLNFFGGGSLSPGLQVSEPHTELVNLSPNSTSSVKYPIYELVSVDWEGDVYDADLKITQKPSLAVDGKDIIPGVKVYGTARIEYITLCYQYVATVTGWNETKANQWDGVVYGCHAGGVDSIILNPPPGADEYDDDCLYAHLSTIDPNGGDVPTPGKRDKYKYFDYCSQDFLYSSYF
jgi:hypothetical protein